MRKNRFVQAAMGNYNSSLTKNGAETNFSSLDPLVDLFNLVGASRGKDITSVFETSFHTEPENTIRTLLWARDARGGAGERETPRNLLRWLEKNNPEYLMRILPKLPELGRWDDLLIFSSDLIKRQAYRLIATALSEQNGLAAKWMPRKGPIANELRKFLRLTPKSYRKLLVSLTYVVETPMCANEWSNINYEHVPSIAASNYAKAFGRHDFARYSAYKDSLKRGTAKVNASVIFPHTVVQASYRGDADIAEAQWKALPNYLDGSNILPIVDVSGSMMDTVGGNTQAIDVSVGLGLYLAEKQKGAFKHTLMTFSSTPSLTYLNPNLNLTDKLNKIRCMDWGMTTDIDAAFELILETAIKNRVPQADMPSILLILSDMEFNRCGKFTAFKSLKNKYKLAGYKLPKVVFWNLKGRVGNSPVTADEKNVALVSGFSPAIMKSILKAKNFSPRDVVLSTILNKRYDF